MSYPPDRIRNFALVGHQSAGKTSLAEAMLACAGVLSRMGTTEAGNTVSDYHAAEKERQISVHASLLHCDWQGTKYNIIDTPGYLDFISEGLGALRVGDFAMVVVNAASGPEIGTDQVWDYADQFQLPKLIVVNGIDKDNVDFDRVLEELRAHYGRKVFPMTLPIDPGPGCRRILDVMRSEEVDYATDGSGNYTEKTAQGPWKDRVRQLHAELIELVAEASDTLLEDYFEQGDLNEDQLRSGVHAAIQAQTFIPVFATSATTNVGVARLMDLVSKYGSSPLDRKIVPAIDEEGHRGDIALGDSNPACYIWKTISEPHVGELSFCRMYSGSITPNTELFNPNRNVTEKIGQIFTLQGHTREPITEIGAGDIGVMAKLRDTHTGDTLTSLERKVCLPAVQYPHPNIHGTLVTLHRGDEDKLSAGLTTLHEEDPTFLFCHNAETHELVVSGQGELHLEVIKSRLARRFNVDVDIVEPRVPFRETIQAPAEAKYRHKKQSGGAGQFAEVWLRIRPTEPGIDFGHSLTGNNVDRVFVPSVEKGVRAACEAGIHAGYPITDVAIDFYDGKMHTVDSKDIAFQTAGKEAFTEAFKNARPHLLEPILSIEVTVPEQYLGDVMSDLSARRGHIHGIEGETKYRTVKGEVPQMEMYRYATTLRSLTSGIGLHSETFSHYTPLPQNLESRILKQPELVH